MFLLAFSLTWSLPQAQLYLLSSPAQLAYEYWHSVEEPSYISNQSTQFLTGIVISDFEWECPQMMFPQMILGYIILTGDAN